MLSAQHQDFDEKASSNYPRDFARWYPLDYFHRPRALKSRRYYVTLSVTIAAAFVCLATALVGRLHGVHQAASVSKAHAGFNGSCSTCHDRAWQPLVRLCAWSDLPSVSDAKCLSCHDGPIHNARQATQPACASCHREHQGKPILAAQIPDRHCTGCHGDLDQHVLHGKTTTFHQRITSFPIDHPEFAPSVPGKKDGAKIRFTHVDHLKLDLAALRKHNPHLAAKYPNKELTCTDCHQVDAQRRYMKPIKYENHCQECHQLTVTIFGDFADEKLKQAAAEFRRTPAPHQDEAIVRAVLRDRFVRFAQAYNVVLGGAKHQPRPLPWRPVNAEVWTWATGQGEKNAALLFANRQMKQAGDQQLTQCSHCHIEAPPRAERPRYEPTRIPSRWYTHSVFNHDSHRMMQCTQCHEQALTSKATADILLPKKQLCQQCHQPVGLARSDCVECHSYHNHQRERSRNGPFTVDEILQKR